MEIYIVRHGETVWNAKNLVQGRTDIELNENGRKLAGMTGQKLESVTFDKIYSSPLIRAYETACLIRGHRNIPIIRDDRLQELCFGINEGQNSRELLADQTNNFHTFFEQPECYIAPENGETFEQICERAKAFMTEVVENEKKETKRIMIVAHGALNKAIMCHVKQHGIEQYWEGGLQKNCGVIIINWDGNTYQVIDETKVFYDENE